MRPLSELINTEDPVWPEVRQWIANASNAVEVLPANDKDRVAALLAIQVTTRSPMGATVYETGGLLIDHGWLRVLGSGHERLPRSLASWNEGRTMFGDGNPPGYLLVADDVVGGFFAINGGSLGPEQGSVFYFAPDRLEWECCGLTYSQFLVWCLQGDVGGYYESLRWPRWEQEVNTVGGDQESLSFHSSRRKAHHLKSGTTESFPYRSCLPYTSAAIPDYRRRCVVL